MKKFFVICYRRLGPYHEARIRSVANVYPHVIALEGSGKDHTYAWDRVEICSFTRRTLFPSDDAQDIGFVETYRTLHTQLSAIAPAVVFIPGWSEKLALALLLWCKLHRTPCVLMTETQECDAKRVWYSELLKSRLVRLFDAALCGGPTHKAYLIKLGLPSSSVFMGYDAVDNAYFSSRVTAIRDQADVLYPDGVNRPYFLASARFIPKKNLAWLVDTYAQYLEQAGDRAFDLVLLGDGELRGALEEQREALNLEGHVHMPGFMQYETLPQYYAYAAAFVHVSTVEQWGLVVNEAMASGLPVLVSNACGVSCLVEDGRNGYVIRTLNPSELVARLLYLTNHEEARVEMGKGSLSVIADWGVERYAQASLLAANRAMEVVNRNA